MSFRSIRRWIPLLALAAISVAAWTMAGAVDVDEAATTPIYYEQSLGSPVLSARRLPETLRAPVIDANLQPAIDTLIAGSGDNQICLTVEVDDRVLAEVSQTTPLVPASNQKILTTFAALDLLGSDATFTTRVGVEGEIIDGVLEGNLYLVGGGDPFLSTQDWWTQYQESSGRSNTSLESLADSVAATGLTTVTGSLFGDESLFDSVRAGPWPQRLIDQKQSGPLSALSVNEGHLDGWPVEYISATQRRQTDNPPLHAVAVFARLLSERGISVASTDVGQAPTNMVEVASIQSPTLLETITHINSYSSNFGAEIVLKHLGLEATGLGTTEAGAQAVSNSLKQQDFDTTGLVVMDGSGLADGIDLDEDGVLERDLLSCALLSDVLETADPDSDFAHSLSIGGERGSLWKRYLESSASGQVFAKTGTLNDVTALSGYVDSIAEDGTTIIFSYVVNGREAGLDVGLKALQQPFIEQLAAYPVGPTIQDLAPKLPIANPVPAILDPANED